jgi:hypothetical protein
MEMSARLRKLQIDVLSNLSALRLIEEHPDKVVPDAARIVAIEDFALKDEAASHLQRLFSPYLDFGSWR